MYRLVSEPRIYPGCGCTTVDRPRFCLRYSTPMFRWLGFAADVEQPVPCYPGGHTIHPDIQAQIDYSGTSPWMPAGYLQHDNGALGVRSSWTVASTITSTATWLTGNVLKYTGLEILARGWAAVSISEQVLFSAGVLHRLWGLYLYSMADSVLQRDNQKCCKGKQCRSMSPHVTHSLTRPRLSGLSLLMNR